MSGLGGLVRRLRFRPHALGFLGDGQGFVVLFVSGCLPVGPPAVFIFPAFGFSASGSLFRGQALFSRVIVRGQIGLVLDRRPFPGAHDEAQDPHERNSCREENADRVPVGHAVEPGSRLRVGRIGHSPDNTQVDSLDKGVENSPRSSPGEK